MEILYVQGFFDRFCSVDESGRAIVLTTKMVDLARLVAARLRQERIQCSIKPMEEGARVKLRVSTRESLERWQAIVGFEDKDKREKLERVLASYGGEDDR